MQHKNLAKGRWRSLTLPEQIGNIGSEYGRALMWKQKGNSEYCDKAFDRMLELIDLTINDVRWRHRLKEITRMREIACQDLFESKKIPEKTLQKYFTQFSILARKKY